MTARSSPVTANSRRAQASMPNASGPPSSRRLPTGAPIASSATIAATSSAATNWISPVDSRTVSPSAPGLDDLGHELEELRGAQDGAGDGLGFDLGLLGDLGAQVAAVGQAVGADDRHREVVPDAGLALGRQPVARRGGEELEHR